MRPIKLTMTAFGAYSQTQVIDFTRLEGKNIFLITGPTGSGKTTIFDGICFAIYGKASGEDRDGENLRSQFADHNTMTVIEMEFELRGTHYYIKRIPKQLRSKARGDGLTEQQAEGELHTIVDGAKGLLASGVSDVNEKIQSIIGIDCDQFRQIVMIPQGDFRKLLTSDSREREKILQKIFQTEIYKSIEYKLNEQAKQMREEIGLLEHRERDQIQSIDPAGNDRLTELIEAENAHTELILTESQVLINRDLEALQRISSRLLEQEQKIQRQQTRIFEAKQNNEKFREKEDLEKQKTEIEKLRPHYEQEQTRLQRGRKASPISVYEEQYQTRKQEKAHRETELQAAAKDLQKQEEVYSSRRREFEAESVKEAEREELRKNIIRLQGYRDQVERLESKRSGVEQFEKEVKKLEKLEKEEEKKQLGGTQKLDGLANELEAARKASVQYVQEHSELQRIGQSLQKVLSLEVENEALTTIAARYRQAEKEYVKKEEAYKDCRENYEKVQELWHAGQAGVLASTLTDGEPCPVCGSAHHPSPAAIKQGHPREEELKQAKHLLEKAEIDKREQEASFSEIKVKGMSQKDKVTDLTKEVEEAIEVEMSSLARKEFAETISEQKRLFLQKKEKQTEWVAGLEKEKGKTDALEKEWTETKQELHNLEQNVKQLQERSRTQKEAYLNERAALNHFLQEIPEEVRTRSSLVQAIDAAEQEHLKRKEIYDQVQKAQDKARVHLEGARVTLTNAEKLLQQAEGAVEAAGKTFEEKVKESGFDSYEEFQDAKMSEDGLNQLEREIHEFFEKSRSIQDRFQKALMSIEGAKREDLSSLEEELNKMKIEREELGASKSGFDYKIKNNKRAMEAILSLQKEKKEQEQAYRIVGELAQVAKGDNSYRLTFERFVLASFLDDILQAANLRLSKMTGSRYQLQRSDELAKYRGQSGLELEVFDHYTGMSRHVRTLSGGEGFKASLSLALGLADVVQSYAGGLTLDTMFIDEGFGTLDPESLDQAIQTLIELQQSGRLVGIISHVPDLKERMDAQLWVEPGKSGSTARFHIL